MVEVLEYAGTGLGIFYFGIISFYPKYIVTALKISIVSCTILAIYGYTTKQYGIAVSQSIYTIMNFIAIFNWKGKEIT